MKNINDDKIKMEDNFLAAVKSGELTMRPRWHFILQAVLMIIGGVIVLFLALYLASFIIFTLHETGVWFVPVFGVAGWLSFFRSLPWILVFFSLVFILILIILVKRFSFAYEKPFVYSLLGIVGVVAVGSSLIAATPLQRGIFDSAQRNQIPIIDDFYRGFDTQQFNDVHRGIVIQTTTDGFIIQDISGETSTVIFVSRASIPLGASITIGETIVIFGDRNGSGTIEAVGAEEIDQP